jgi:hypothetical protein
MEHVADDRVPSSFLPYRCQCEVVSGFRACLRLRMADPGDRHDELEASKIAQQIR